MFNFTSVASLKKEKKINEMKTKHQKVEGGQLEKEIEVYMYTHIYKYVYV